MYEVLIFQGGIYKFNDFQELIEDLGGLILKKDHLEITRGIYFLSEEITVPLVLPVEEIENAKEIAKEIKGNLSKTKIDSLKKSELVSYLNIYDLLSKSDHWLEKRELEEQLKCPCIVNCEKSSEFCAKDYLNKILNDMETIELIEVLEENNKKKYRLRVEND
ncbi:MAG: methyl-coenzyme M reductase family protein [Methanobacteriaceae archaeon]|nr:methyl-coenzyme M reductase family protein [Methanobacteriaceae archaeon]